MAGRKTLVAVDDRYGRLTVIGFTRSRKLFCARVGVYCQCDCGNIICTVSQSLRRGATKSCGCLRNERTGKQGNDASAKRRNKLYVRWRNMPGSPQGVCLKWLDYKNFKAWWLAQNYTVTAKHIIRLKDATQPYGPGNVNVITVLKHGERTTRPQNSPPQVTVDAIRAAYRECGNATEISRRFLISRPTIMALVEGINVKRAYSDYAAIREAYRSNMNKVQVAKLLGVSRNTVRKAIATDA